MSNPVIRLVGIDPGKTGAIAFLTPGSMSLTVHDMPTVPNASGKEQTNMHELASILSPEPGDRHIAVVERVSAMPRDGVTSAFNFGENYGAIQMALIGHGWEIHYVTPAVWKRHFKLSSDKGVSRGLASQRFPSEAKSFARVKDHGRAEAAMIALYGAEKLL